jgi:hypothetical protein
MAALPILLSCLLRMNLRIESTVKDATGDPSVVLLYPKNSSNTANPQIVSEPSARVWRDLLPLVV